MTAHSVETQRVRLLVQLELLLERPMIWLAFAWLVLVIIELTYGVTREGEIAGTVIWVLFGIDFLVKLIIAPRKITFIRRNWITAVSLLLPALRIARIGRLIRGARTLRGLRFARLLGSVNRGMRAVRRAMRRHGFGYVVTLTLLVLFAGAAGMMAFEREGPNSDAFANYWSSLWWTAMLMTSLGSEYWPRTGPGRTLTLLLAIYSFAVFGYITATLASFFIDVNEEEKRKRRESIA